VSLLAAAPAVAARVDIWPLFHLRSDAQRGLLRWTALGPLLEYRRTPERQELFLRPVLWLARHQDSGQERAELFFPLVALRREPGFRSARLLLLSGQHDDGATDRLALFPLLFWRRQVAYGASLGILPWFLRQDQRFGFDEVDTIAFPLWLRVRSGGVDRRFHPFPFVSTVRGAGRDASGLRIWPLAGCTDIPGQERTRYALWPLWIDQDRWTPGYGLERRRVRFPLWSALDGKGRHSRGWGMLAYTHTIDQRLGSEAIGSPWPLVLRERPLGETRWRTFRVAPFWGRSDDGQRRSRFWLWPLLRSSEEDLDEFHARRRDLLLVLGRLQWQWDETRGHEESLATLFPLGRHLHRNGAMSGQVPALVDAFTPRNRGVLALWAPLWAVMSWEAPPGAPLDWTLGWGVLAREHGQLRGPLGWER